MGLKIANNVPKIDYVGDFLLFLDLIQPLKLYIFYLVEEFLSFDLVGHMWKLVKNWFQKCIFCGKFCGKFELAYLESAYSLIRGPYKIWGKGGGDTLALL